MAGLSNSGGGGLSAIRLGRAYVEAYLDANQLFRGLDKVKTQFRQAGAFLAKSGALAGGIGAALTAPLVASVSVFKDFDDAMRLAGAVTGATGDELEALTEKAKLLGRTTSFSAVEVAKLFTELGRAGFSAEQIDTMTASALNMARATGETASHAAEILSAAIRQYGLDATDATRVSDLFTATANKSAASVEDLGLAFSYAGPFLANLGVSLEDSLALAGALANIGIKGSAAGTALRRLGTTLAAESDKVESAFGVMSKDAAGNARPIVDVLEDVFKAIKGMPTGEMAEKFKDVFGLLSVTSASSLAKNTGAVRKLRQELEDSAGIAARTAAEMDAGIGGAWRRFKGAIEGIAIAIGEALAPSLLEAAVWVQRVTTSVRNFINENRQAVVITAAIAAGLTAAGVALATFGVSVALVGTGVAALLAALKLVAGGIAFLVSPVGLVTAAFAGLVALWATGTQGGRQFVEGVRGNLEGMKGGLLEFAETAKTVWGGVQDAIKAGDLTLAFQVAAAGLQLEWSKVVLFWTEKWVAFKTTVIEGWDDIIKKIGEAVDRANLFTVKTLTGGAIDTPEKLGKARGAVGGVVDDFLAGAGMAGRAYTAFSDTVAGAAGKLSDFVSSVGGWDREVRRLMGTTVKGPISSLPPAAPPTEAAPAPRTGPSAEDRAREAARAERMKSVEAARAAVDAAERELRAARERAFDLANPPRSVGNPLFDPALSMVAAVLKATAQKALSLPTSGQLADSVRGGFDTTAASRRFGGVNDRLVKNTAATAENTGETTKAVLQLISALRFH